MRKALIAVAILVVAVLAAPFVVPTSAWLPKVAAAASEALGEPVDIAELRFHLVPTPRLVAKDIRVGRSGEARIGELEIVPVLSSLVSGPTTLRLVRAKGVDVREGALGILERLPSGEGSGGGAEVRRVVLQRARLELPGGGNAELDAVIEPKPGDVLALSVDARHWQVAKTPLRFEALRAKGRLLGGKALEVASVDGALFGGALNGTLRVEWSKAWKVAGKLAVEGVDLVALERALDVAPRLSGRLKADATFSASATDAEGLLPALVVDAPFEIVGGAYRGIDLASVGDLTGARGQGGATPFQQFTGTLALRGRRVRIEGLCVRSPKLVAGGSVQIAPDDRLSGRLDVALAKARRLTRVPVVLSGTTEEPKVRPSKGYLIGALVGTVLMPGVGTGIGASAGGALTGKAGGCG